MICVLGQGQLVDDLDEADFILCADREIVHHFAPSVTWQGKSELEIDYRYIYVYFNCVEFIAMIPGNESLLKRSSIF